MLSGKVVPRPACNWQCPKHEGSTTRNRDCRRIIRVEGPARFPYAMRSCPTLTKEPVGTDPRRCPFLYLSFINYPLSLRHRSTRQLQDTKEWERNKGTGFKNTMSENILLNSRTLLRVLTEPGFAFRLDRLLSVDMFARRDTFE
jgi:hypothetical protein